MSEPWNCQKHDGRTYGQWKGPDITKPAGYKVSQRTVNVAGQTLYFREGCNKCRARIIRDMLTTMKRKSPPAYYAPVQTRFHDHAALTEPLCGSDWFRDHLNQELPDQEITITVDGQNFTRNGDFKRGDVKEFMAAFCKPGRTPHIRKGPIAAERRADAFGVYMTQVLGGKE